MDFLRRYWTTIIDQLKHLDSKSKVLIGALVVILLLSLYLVLQYAGSSVKEPITKFVGENKVEVIRRLEAAGIDVETEGNQVLVPSDQKLRVFAILAESSLLAEDTSNAFDDYLTQQNIWKPNAQDKRAYLLAKRKVLGQMIRRMKGVHAAEVMIDHPEDKRFAESYTRPHAAVSLIMEGQAPVRKQLVSAVANLVAGAVAEMKPQDVQVIDAGNGRNYTVDSEEDMIGNQAIEKWYQFEKRYKEKVAAVLKDIPGVIVGVSVQIDKTARTNKQSWERADKQPIARERRMEEERTNVRMSGEPGMRAMTGMEVPSGGTTEMRESRNETETEMMSAPIREVASSVETGHLPKQVNVTVSVPRSYFVQVYKATNGADQEPDDATLQPFVQQQLPLIEARVAPLIETDARPGVVRASMVFDAGSLMLGAGEDAGAGGIMGVLESEWAKPAPLVAMCLLALTMLFMMVRSATKQPPMPSVEELAGVPPMLPTDDDDLVGEAEEAEPSMAGVEIDEDEIRVRKLAEQIGDMIKANPQEAGMIFNKWSRTGD
jgi:flagellar M-ring protein FliF